MNTNKIDGLKPLNFVRKNLIEFIEARTGCKLGRHERLALGKFLDAAAQTARPNKRITRGDKKGGGK